MELTKEQNRLRKDTLIKAHYWFGSDDFEEVFKDYDFYVDTDEAMFYVYRSEDKLKNVVCKKAKEKNIEALAKALIKAIDDNTIEADEGIENDEPTITQRFIADELEELRSAVK